MTDIAPGDICNATRKDTCYEGAECKEGVCAAKSAAGGSCKGEGEGAVASDKWCPVGQYCNAAADPPVCADILAAAAECTTNSQCGYESVCIQQAKEITGETKNTCVAFASLEDGTQISSPNPSPCKSWNVYSTSDDPPKHYCMP